MNGSSGPIRLSASNLPAASPRVPDQPGDGHGDALRRRHATARLARSPSLAPVVAPAGDGHGDPVGLRRRHDAAGHRAGDRPRRVRPPRARASTSPRACRSAARATGSRRRPSGPPPTTTRASGSSAYGYKPTIARFYADASRRGQGRRLADATLEGFRDGKPLPGQPAPPRRRRRRAHRPRAEHDGDLRGAPRRPPRRSTSRSRRAGSPGQITLRAHVGIQPAVRVLRHGPRVRRCRPAPRTTRSSCGTSASPRRRTSRSTRSRSSTTTARSPARPTSSRADWYDPFRVANQIMPIHLLPEYWRGTIDVTTHKVFKGFKGWVTRASSPTTASSARTRLGGQRPDSTTSPTTRPDINFPVGILGYLQPVRRLDAPTWARRTAGPSTRTARRSSSTPAARTRSVAHEVGHALRAPARLGRVRRRGERREGRRLARRLRLHRLRRARRHASRAPTAASTGLIGGDDGRRELRRTTHAARLRRPRTRRALRLHVLLRRRTPNAWISAIGWNELHQPLQPRRRERVARQRPAAARAAAAQRASTRG